MSAIGHTKMEETEDHQQPTELEKEIFGDSDSSISYSGEAMEDVEQEQLKGSEEEDADEVESEDSDDDDLGKKKPSSSIHYYEGTYIHCS